MPESPPKSAHRRARVLLLTAVLLVGLAIIAQQMFSARTVQAISSGVVISQVYGGAGCASAGCSTYKNDYIELFNRGTVAVSLNGWSVQYASAAGTTWTPTNLTNVLLQPGQYYLVGEGAGANGVNNIPTADATGAIAMAAGAAKVALVNSTTALTGACPASANIVDLIGYGSTATCFETAVAPAPSTTNADIRNNSGCAETDSNSADFTASAANPRNTASTLHPCNANQAIVPSCPGTLNTVQGTATFANVSATDADGTVTSASITSTPVAGITLDSFTPAGAVGGTASATLNVSNATAAGTYNVVIQYQNNDSPTPQTATCTVVVTVTPPNQPIAPSCPGSLNTNQGSAGSVNVSASDPDGTVTTASITSAPVAGISLDSFTPAGAVGGTASATLNVANTTAAGTYNVDIQWTNNDSPTPQTASCTVVVTVQPLPPVNNVVISQVYGGGGNTGSTLMNDYIELINHSSSPVNLNGWSVQAFVSTTSTWQITPLTNFTLQPGQYYLIQESQGAGGTDPLPTPDAIGTIAVSSTSTKVALVNNTTLITTACPNAGAAGIVDLVGYGPTDCFEGSAPAPLLSNTTADFRLNGGCFDTNDNSVDFVTGAPSPHNTSSAAHLCTSLSATGSANPSTVLQGNSTTLTVHVAPAQNPDSTGLTVIADLSLIGGSPTQSFSGAGTTFTFVATVPANNPSGLKSLPVSVGDAQARTANTNIPVTVLSTTPEHVTISQVYGGGGNTGATYANDYVELYNPTAAPITMTGWSLQYGSATGTSFSGKQVLGGTIDPGHYYLVSLASGGAVGAPLPPASVTGTDINMSATAGKIVLVSNSDTLSGACPFGTDPDIVDFVGYGTTANCHEGTANAPAGSNTTALFRKTGGSTDTDQNGNDFVSGAPNPRSTTPVVEFGPSVAGTDPNTNDTIAPYDSSITANFSEAVDAVGVWYNVSCTVTGLHNVGTSAHSGDFKTWAFTPNATFQFGEQCTATIFKNQIHDQDTDDSGPDSDTLTANYVWSFTVVGAGAAAPYPPSVHLTMGNPSNAVADVGQPLNFLMMKPTYAVSYNRDKGTPNWVSWHLDPSWYGTLARVDTFRPDPAVDPTWYRVQAFDYSLSGFDRGHMTPNADRDNQNRIPINQETYLMSNMVPQAPDNNQGPWANLEGDLRTLADAGNELYIVSGPLGVGGIGSASGNTVNTIANGHVTVPASTWKVVLVLPSGSGDDISRVTCSTRTIAVMMPNTQGIRNTDWHTFLTTVDAIEQATGYDLYSNLPPAVQACVEAGNNGVNPPGTADQSASTPVNTPVTITLQALRSNSNTLAFSVVNGPANGSLGSIGTTSCTGDNCTATVSYTPGSNYSGPDSFTFRASDGSINSNVSIVSITVTKVNQTITFGALANKTFGDPDFTVSATATSGLPVSFAASGQCTVTGATVHLTSPGSCTITASQAGNSNFNAATNVQQGFTITGALVTLSQSNYNVNESDGAVTITVNRTGDVSVPFTVDYVTDDTGAPSQCAPAGGNTLASSRCDFGLTLGTLKFAAGETQKTFVIPIIQDSYTEGPETFTVNLSNLIGTGAAFATPSSATVTISDGATTLPPNAIDDTNVFVRMHYHDFLNREPDAAGLAFWTGEINNCTPKPQCTAIKRVYVSAAFFLSIEFQTTGNLVRSFYVAALDRPATNNMPNFVEFMRDTQAMQAGVIVGQGNWQTTLNDNRTAFMNAFVMRTEFVGLYPTTDTPTQYVDKLYLHAGVIPGTPQERTDAIAEFGAASTAADPGARGRALLRITQNTAFQSREINRAFVQVEYFGYLRRNPNDPPDGNFAGYNFWVNKLNQFNGDFVKADMVNAFLSSSEYRSRFGPN